ncbi:SET and MYND domain-containing protein 4-like, partial [Sceloporus undulatus]|uniref:SET and MYND domain-containing protein 4-like n=1 Tax=Sceloporus undulatus TaxID=8520 RepID=UPI001C4A9D77
VCLEDIKRAQEGGYPERLAPKLLLRKAECLLSLGRWQEMTEVLGSVETAVSAGQGLEAPNHQVLLHKLTQLKAKACKERSSLAPGPTLTHRTEADSEPWKENSHVSCTSSSVRLNFSTHKGRHLVATADILPGELLVREEAFVSVLRPGKQLLHASTAKVMLDRASGTEDLHCHHCLRQLLASIPCQGCSYAKYCSHVCAQLAWKSYHRRECPLGGLLLTLGVFCHVALRAVLVAGFAEVRHLVKEWSAESLAEASVARAVTEGDAVCIPGCDAEGQYSSSYRSVFSLLPHSEKHSPEFQFLCSLSVAALCKGLRDSGLEASFLRKDMADNHNGGRAAEAPLELEVLGEAMLRHMLQLQCNAQAVTTLRVSGSEAGLVTSSEQVCLATALFPVLSLLNHSCDPNTSVAFSGQTAEVRASQPIPQGQEILHCYGPHKCRMGAKERRKSLRSQYFFECQCPSCTEELGPKSRNGASPRKDGFCCPTCNAPMQGERLLRCSSSSCTALLPKEGFQNRLRDLRQLTKTAMEL